MWLWTGDCNYETLETTRENWRADEVTMLRLKFAESQNENANLKSENERLKEKLCNAVQQQPAIYAQASVRS